jgi:hypothetical protein
MPYHLFDIIVVGKTNVYRHNMYSQRKTMTMMMRMSFGLVYVVCLHVGRFDERKNWVGESCLLTQCSLNSKVVRMILPIFGIKTGYSLQIVFYFCFNISINFTFWFFCWFGITGNGFLMCARLSISKRTGSHHTHSHIYDDWKCE